VPQAAVMTNFYAEAHPSQPNYFALYAGSTFGVTDDRNHDEPDPSLYTILNGAVPGVTFTGYEYGSAERRRDGRRVHNKARLGFLVTKLAFVRRYGVAG